MKRFYLKSATCNICLLLMLSITSPLLWGNESASEEAIENKLNANWQRLLKSYQFKPSEQSFCYQNPAGEVSGSGVDRKVRLASVSKLITSYWAVEQLGKDYRYSTEFFYHNEQLHIKGGDDPLLAKRKIFFLVSQLNNWGITRIKRLTFDSNVKVYAKAEDYLGSVLRVTRSRTQTNLKDFFDRSNWNKLKAAYKKFIASLPATLVDELHMIRDLEQLELKVDKVEFSDSNPLADGPNTESYQHLSSLISRYLKFMNIVSNNFIADQVFFQLGGETSFDQFIATFMQQHFPNYNDQREGFASNEASIKLYTGSGLNTRREGKRVDNYATCRVVVKLIDELDRLLTSQGGEIWQLVAVPGVDGGTFRRRLRSPRLAKLMVAKTGTLYHTSALAGMISAKDGNNFFGIFHQKEWGAPSAKIIQNKMVVKMVDLLGAGERFNYTPTFFFPADTPLVPVQ